MYESDSDFFGRFPNREQLARAEIALIAETGLSAHEIDLDRRYCVCGDLVDQHIPMDCGHEPVPAWEYAVYCKAQEMLS